MSCVIDIFMVWDNRWKVVIVGRDAVARGN